MYWAAPTDPPVIGFHASWEDVYNLPQYSQTLKYFADSAGTNLSMGIETSMKSIWAFCDKNYEFL